MHRLWRKRKNARRERQRKGPAEHFGPACPPPPGPEFFLAQPDGTLRGISQVIVNGTDVARAMREVFRGSAEFAEAFRQMEAIVAAMEQLGERSFSSSFAPRPEPRGWTEAPNGSHLEVRF